ncbi:hypothetical protein O287_02699 [Staphylococcus aureus M0094]|uniref:hypothetical protein n=1 Tax=Staphylococcus TaxID=1279 RepID=UPI00025F4DE3|nr:MULTISPECIES: hypothetical protein [Staphylococcus]EIK02857.1 hypothetical protein MQC_02586 [Staphylococcus aureus subsp. aureus VRS2]EIK19729.1 hypothetical protein MQM_02643 [Staphylococcus aureus subsp. aureus VRS7]EUI21227.1 hypothetical protein Q113_02688 [Staphylococcus aureus M1439]EUS74959.1 hypothetical protein O274_02720 [Staphylococcus aureus M0076]EUS77714.1 hypothetical protein O275_02711 [Staphylococcus aureus M0079]
MKKVSVKTFKISPITSILVEVFEIIYTEQGKANALKYGITNNDLFEYQTKREYNAKILQDLVEHGLQSLHNIEIITPNFDEMVKAKPTKSKTIELPNELFNKVNQFIKENSLSGQEFMLQALERTIIRNKLNIDYLKSLVEKVYNYRVNEGK